MAEAHDEHHRRGAGWLKQRPEPFTAARKGRANSFITHQQKRSITIKTGSLFGSYPAVGAKKLLALSCSGFGLFASWLSPPSDRLQQPPSLPNVRFRPRPDLDCPKLHKIWCSPTMLLNLSRFSRGFSSPSSSDSPLRAVT